MNRKVAKTVGGNLALILLLSTVWRMKAQDTRTPYPRMAPIDQYLISRESTQKALGTGSVAVNPGRAMPMTV